MYIREYEDKELAKLAAANDEEALRELLRRHIGLIKTKAEHFKRRASHVGVRFNDLVTVGETAVYDAARDYEPERGTKFSTFAGSVIRNKMSDFITQNCQSHTISIASFLGKEGELTETAESSMQLINEKSKVEPQVVRKVFYEQFRDCFLKLPLRQQMILAYKFGYDPGKPVLSCEGRVVPDRKVVAHYQSKMNLIVRDKKNAYEQLRKGMFGERGKDDTVHAVREPGRFIKEDFWISHN